MSKPVFQNEWVFQAPLKDLCPSTQVLSGSFRFYQFYVLSMQMFLAETSNFQRKEMS